MAGGLNQTMRRESGREHRRENPPTKSGLGQEAKMAEFYRGQARGGGCGGVGGVRWSEGGWGWGKGSKTQPLGGNGLG